MRDNKANAKQPKALNEMNEWRAKQITAAILQKASAKQANRQQGVKVDLLSSTWHTVYPFIHRLSVRPPLRLLLKLVGGCLPSGSRGGMARGWVARVATDASLANSHSPRCARSKRVRGTHEASVSRLMCSVTVFLLRPACLAACLRPCCQRQSTSHMPHAPPQVNNNNNKNMATARATTPLAAAMIFEINSTWFCFLACCFGECEGVDVARGYWRLGEGDFKLRRREIKIHFRHVALPDLKPQTHYHSQRQCILYIRIFKAQA